LETSLRPVDEIQFSEVRVATDEVKVIDSDRHIWWSLAFLAFIFLLFEWWYFQRAKGGLAA
jgi:Ca-activated chloride channel homolog